MKRYLIPLAVAALGLVMAGGAPAATAPPKNLCLQFTNLTIFKISLVVKLVGTINTSAGPVKFYALNGGFYITSINSSFSIPVSGTGHVNGTKFQFSLVGTMPTGTEAQTFNGGSKDYDLVTQSGTLLFQYLINGTAYPTVTDAIQAVDCKTSVPLLEAESE
jgi:hypothetical protein